MTLIVSYKNTLASDTTICMGTVTSHVNKIFSKVDGDITTYFAGCGTFAEVIKLRNLFLYEVEGGEIPEDSATGMFVEYNKGTGVRKHGYVEHTGFSFEVNPEEPVICAVESLMLASTVLIKTDYLDVYSMEDMFKLLNNHTTINLSGFQCIDF